MARKTINNPKFQYVDSAGEVLDGGKLYTYEAGTVTPRATYSDSALTSANANPVILDSNGEATIYGTGLFKLVLKTSLDVEIWTEDNIAASDSVISKEVRDYGAIGDGVTNDTAAINAALATGGVIYASDGVFSHTGLIISVADTTFIVNSDAKLVLADNSDTHSISVEATATDCLVTGGGTLDCNGANQSSGNGILVAANRCTIEEMRVEDAFFYGIRTINVQDPTIRNNTVIDSLAIGIYIANNVTPSQLRGAVIDGNVVDRTGISAATVSTPGISSHGFDPAGFQQEIRYTNNRVRMPTSPTDGTAVCIECWGTFVNMVATGNITQGGSIGISLGGDTGLGSQATVTGNSCRNFDRYGIELNAVDFITVTGNTVNGGSLGSTAVGIGTSGTTGEADYCNITGNVVSNCSEGAIRVIADSDNLAINSNTIRHPAVTPAVLVTETRNTTINSNVIDGLGTGTNGIEARGSTHLTMNDNLIDNFATNGILLQGTTAIVINQITICGNTVTNCGTTLNSSLAGGATLGTNIKVTGNIGITDYLSFGENIQRMVVVTATPEGSVTAGIGSTAINTTGGAGTTFYVKESGTGNTGWVGK